MRIQFRCCERTAQLKCNGNDKIGENSKWHVCQMHSSHKTFPFELIFRCFSHFSAYVLTFPTRPITISHWKLFFKTTYGLCLQNNNFIEYVWHKLWITVNKMFHTRTQHNPGVGLWFSTGQTTTLQYIYKRKIPFIALTFGHSRLHEWINGYDFVILLRRISSTHNQSTLHTNILWKLNFIIRLCQAYTARLLLGCVNRMWIWMLIYSLVFPFVIISAFSTLLYAPLSLCSSSCRRCYFIFLLRLYILFSRWYNMCSTFYLIIYLLRCCSQLCRARVSYNY